MINLAPLILLLPLLGFAAHRHFRAELSARGAPVRHCRRSWPRGSWPWSWSSAALAHGFGFGDHGTGITLWRWIPAIGFTADMGLFVDSLTACLLIVVTTIGMLVHFYSLGYMAHDPGRWRFFAYLNLFMFSMLLLVLADNFLLVFAGWELVGLCSYLLIGFWYPRRSAAVARPRRRSWSTASATWASRSGSWPSGPSSARSTCRRSSRSSAPCRTSGRSPSRSLLLCGAVGKSAQFPLHVWLPDAMEGPTPVSALIHAATMVNAGVYLIARGQPDLRPRRRR